jgi:hypothetical protein
MRCGEAWEEGVDYIRILELSVGVRWIDGYVNNKDR